MADIPPSILEALNKGEIETKSLVEWLAVDALFLLEHLGFQGDEALKFSLQEASSILQKSKKIGVFLAEKKPEHLEVLAKHSSDVVRIWVMYAYAHQLQNDVRKSLEKAKIFAQDEHFGVREIAWMAVRPLLVENLEACLEILRPWVHDSHEGVRRFVSELTRPRGVWCPALPLLQKNPELCLDILEALQNDPSLYVQKSVGNWLNDAGKTRPDFVLALAERWSQKPPLSKAKQKILKLGLRRLPS